MSLALAMAASPALIGNPAVAAAVMPLWDHPGYDAEDSHFNPLETGVTGQSIARITRRWQADLRTSDRSCSTFGGPVLAAGRIHVSDQLGLSTYEAETGKILWRYDWDYPDDNETPRLALSDGLLIVAGGDCNSQSDPDGRLLALDARTGLPRWRLHLDTPVHSVVVDKHVIVVSGGSPSDEDRVAAYAARDGRALWSRDKTLTSEVSANGTLLVRSTSDPAASAGVIHGLAVTDGRELWRQSGSWTAQAASPRSELFYATDKSGVLKALKVADGTTVWTAPAPNPATERPSWARDLIAADWNQVYRVTGRNVEALSVLDGEKVWSAGQDVVGTQPVRAGGLLYAGGAVLDPADGTVAGRAWPGHVIVAGGRIHQLEKGVLTTWAS